MEEIEPVSNFEAFLNFSKPAADRNVIYTRKKKFYCPHFFL